MFDVAIIGAGINGSIMAYELRKEFQNIALFDMEGIAAGGSGAAGAFISPKFSKEGELKELLQEAFIYSMEYYKKHFKHYFHQAPLIHIAKDAKDAKILQSYKQTSSLDLLDIDTQSLTHLTQEALDKEKLSLKAGIVDAKEVCLEMAKSAKYIDKEIDTLVYDNGVWIINNFYNAKRIILATGAYKSVLDEPYINIRGVWGHRIDIKSTIKNSASLHQYVSISPSIEGKLSIGATHNVHYHPQTTQEVYNKEQGRAELLEKAQKTFNLEEIEIIQDFTGLRSGSSDYMPLVGKVAISKESMKLGRYKLENKKTDFEEYSYYPELYMLNGSSGYGFVFAPLLAKMLKEHIVQGKKISARLSPSRYFSRWARRNL